MKEVESLGRKLGFTGDNGKFHNISLGQGQDIVAERALDQGSRDGHWVVLQNIHLVARWLPQLEKKLEQTGENAHEEFRVFLSAEPAPDPDGHVCFRFLSKLYYFPENELTSLIIRDP